MSADKDLPKLLLGARGVLFDLDETLVVERRSAEEAVEACCDVARARCGDLDARRMAVEVFEVARRLWRATPTIEYARAVGISSWEGLWSRFDGAGEGLAALRRSAEAYRRRSWAGALRSQGCFDEHLALELADRFVSERKARLSTFADAEPLLRALADAGTPMSVVTNGAPDSQRAKLACCGLTQYFGLVWISAEVGIGKPDPRLWRLAADHHGGPAADLAVIGDSESKDIEPCLGLGLTAIRVDRATTGVRKVGEQSYVVGSLADLTTPG